jgi:hypothetical protein
VPPDAVAAAMTTIFIELIAVCHRARLPSGCWVIFFPVLLLIIACAAVFGPLAGIAYSSAGLLASAFLNYGVARSRGGAQHAGERIAKGHATGRALEQVLACRLADPQELSPLSTR